MTAVHPHAIPCFALLALLAATPAVAQQDTAQQRRQQPRERQSSDGNEEAQARVDNIPLDPAMAGFFSLPGTNWRMRIGGYAKTDAMYDTRPAGLPDLFVTSSIPTGDPPAGEGSSYNMHVRQTRLSLDVRRPSQLGGDLRVYLEGDLYGPGGTTQPNLRHAYIQAANLLVGRTFSTFMDVDALPDGVDFEGPPSSLFVLAAQVRYTRPFGERWSVAFAAEQPSTDFAVPPGGTPVTSLPDIVVRPRYEAPWGHVQLAGVVRRLGYNDGLPGSNSATAYGLHASALLAATRRDNVSAGGIWGEGVAHYTVDFGGIGLDAAVDAGGTFQALPLYGWYVSLQHLFSPRYRGVATTGWLRVEPTNAQPATTTSRTQYGSLAFIWTPRPTVDFGFTAIYGEHHTVNGSMGHAWRYQGAIQLYIAQ